jgi:hypothetical protein
VLTASMWNMRNFILWTNCIMVYFIAIYVVGQQKNYKNPDDRHCHNQDLNCVSLLSNMYFSLLSEFFPGFPKAV